MLAAMERILASSPNPTGADNRRRTWAIAVGLLVLALVPRAIVAFKSPYLCPDGTYYVQLSRQLDEGRPTPPLIPDLFNLFPQILRGLHKLGLSWEAGAKSWNVLCGTLVALPLWGWLRRQFDERLALAAALLCASHPKLIEWSGEVVREPTFWLCFVTALYAAWRAAAENRALWWGAAGLAAALAVQTRTEGWLLALPLAGWWMGNVLIGGSRMRPALGLALMLAAYPAVVTPINLAVHGGAQPIEWGTSLHRLLYVSSWLEEPGDNNKEPATATAASAPEVAVVETTPNPSSPAIDSSPVPVRDVSPEPQPTPSAGNVVAQVTIGPDELASATPAVEPPTAVPVRAPILPPMTVTAESADRFTRRHAAGVYFRALVRGLTPIYLALTALGIAWNWRQAFDWRQAPLLAVTGAASAAIWIHLAEAHLTSSRYWLLVVLTLSPWTAAGLCNLAQWLPWRPALSLSVSLAALVASGWCYAAALPQDVGRQAKAELGHWVVEHLGPGQRVVGTPRLKMMEYYAQANFQILPQLGQGVPDWNDWIGAQQPDLVALSNKDLSPEAIQRVTENLSNQGWQAIPAEALPRSCRHTSVVLARRSGAWK